MKEKLTLRNAILWTAALAGLILFFVSFGAKAKLSGLMGEYYGTVTFHNAVWGCRTMTAFVEGKTTAEVLAKGVGSISGIIGVILLLLASGGLVAISLLIKDEKLGKILTFVCAGVILTAGILLFFVSNVVWRVMQEMMLEEGMPITIEQLKTVYAGAKASSGYGIAGGIISILLAGGVVASQLIPNKQFIK